MLAKVVYFRKRVALQTVVFTLCTVREKIVSLFNLSKPLRCDSNHLADLPNTPTAIKHFNRFRGECLVSHRANSLSEQVSFPADRA